MYDISWSKEVFRENFSWFQKFQSRVCLRSSPEWGSLDPLPPQPAGAGGRREGEGRDTAFLRRENPDKDQFSPTPKLPDDKTFIKHGHTMASAKPLWGRQRGLWLVEAGSARTSSEPMGARLAARKWLQGKGPQRQLGFDDGDEVMEGGTEKAVWWSTNSSQSGAKVAKHGRLSGVFL